MADPYQPIYPGNWDQLNDYLSELTSEQYIADILSSVAAVNWRPLTLLNGMTDGRPPYAPARYRLTLNNVVHVEGRVSRTPGLSDPDVGLVIAKLATDSLPGGDLVYAAPSGASSIARLVVSAAGEISFQGLIVGTTAATAISLSGINFSVGSAQPT